MKNRLLRIATRRSELALWQAEHVRGLLAAASPGIRIELLPLATEGDRIIDRPLSAIGGKGLFLKGLEQALLDGRADLAVHSMKDVPAEETPGLPVVAMLERANPFDAIVSRDAYSLDTLPSGARLGTSSLRRQCQLRALRPDLRVEDLRGNVGTRLRKLDEGAFDAIVLACAGLERLGQASRIGSILKPPEWLPAVAQGTIGIQCREADAGLCDLLRTLGHAESTLCTRAERAVSLGLKGSCQLPLAVFARIGETTLAIDALVGRPDGRQVLRCRIEGQPESSAELVKRVVEDLRAQGADRIIAASRASRSR